MPPTVRIQLGSPFARILSVRTMTQQTKALPKVSNIPVPGGLDLDQLRTIINSLNLLAEQEEGEYSPISCLVFAHFILQSMQIV